MNIKDILNTKVDMRGIKQMDDERHLVEVSSSSEEGNFMSVIKALSMAEGMKAISLMYADAHNKLVAHIEKNVPDGPYEDHMHKVLLFDVRDDGRIWVQLRDLYMWAEGTSGISEFGASHIAMKAIRGARLK